MVAGPQTGDGRRLGSDHRHHEHEAPAQWALELQTKVVKLDTRWKSQRALYINELIYYNECLKSPRFKNNYDNILEK